MSDITVFKRYELKYQMTLKQKEKLLRIMSEYMEIDQYKRTTIQNIYYDTPDFRLIRTSLDKPLYKEKLRVRSYGKAADDGKVFIELKKKYDSVVYKRRISMSNRAAEMWLEMEGECAPDTQIAEEIEYFRNHYKGLKPQVFLSYEREAYYMKDGSDFRVTFDDHILGRRDHLSLTEDAWGTPILPEDRVLMELKVSAGIPMWMGHFLSEEKIVKTSFSKYGSYYEKVIYPESNAAARSREYRTLFMPEHKMSFGTAGMTQIKGGSLYA